MIKQVTLKKKFGNSGCVVYNYTLLATYEWIHVDVNHHFAIPYIISWNYEKQNLLSFTSDLFQDLALGKDTKRKKEKKMCKFI